MPRPLRVHHEGAGYLVTSRARSQETLFKDEIDVRVYLTLLQDYRGRHGVTVFAYCLLPEEVRTRVWLPGHWEERG